MEGVFERKGGMTVRGRHEAALDDASSALEAQVLEAVADTSEGTKEQYETPADGLTAEARRVREVIDRNYQEALKQNEYFGEHAAAKLKEFAGAYEAFVLHYAELSHFYPQTANRMERILPALGCLEEHGKELVAESKETDNA